MSSARRLRLRSIDLLYQAMVSQLPPPEANLAKASVFVSTLSPACRYLHLVVRDLRQPAQPAFDAYWSLADVCRQIFGDDRVAPQWVADEMIEAIALDWSRDGAWHFGVDGLHVQSTVGITDGKDCRHFLFAQMSEVGTLFTRHRLRGPPRVPGFRMPGFPLPLIYRVGRCPLDRAQIESLRHGDIVRLISLAPTVLLDGRRLCDFRFDGDTLVIERMHEVEMDQDDPSPQFLAQTHAPAEDEPMSWTQLTLTCDFLLPPRRFRLADLDALHEGTILPMDAAAITQVEMCVGKQVVAIGELVQIGETLGFEVTRMLIKPSGQGDASGGQLHGQKRTRQPKPEAERKDEQKEPR